MSEEMLENALILHLAYSGQTITSLFEVNPTITLSSLRCNVYYSYCKLWSFDIAKAVTLDQKRQSQNLLVVCVSEGLNNYKH